MRKELLTYHFVTIKSANYEQKNNHIAMYTILLVDWQATHNFPAQSMRMNK